MRFSVSILDQRIISGFVLVRPIGMAREAKADRFEIALEALQNIERELPGVRRILNDPQLLVRLVRRFEAQIRREWDQRGLIRQLGDRFQILYYLVLSAAENQQLLQGGPWGAEYSLIRTLAVSSIGVAILAGYIDNNGALAAITGFLSQLRENNDGVYFIANGIQRRRAVAAVAPAWMPDWADPQRDPDRVIRNRENAFRSANPGAILPVYMNPGGPFDSVSGEDALERMLTRNRHLPHASVNRDGTMYYDQNIKTPVRAPNRAAASSRPKAKKPKRKPKPKPAMKKKPKS